MKEIDFLKQDSNALDKAITDNREELDKNGFDPDLYERFNIVREALGIKTTTQKKSKEEIIEKTQVQDISIESKRKLLGQVRTAAKVVYGKNPQKLKLFMVGEDIPKSVGGVTTLCNHMYLLVNERKAEFIKAGFSQAKIDALQGGAAEVDASDTDQEATKKKSKSATISRDDAAAELKDIVFRIRNSAKLCFESKPEILVQFNPIPRGRGGTKKKPPQNPPDNK
jgi:hypothetical protein